DKTLSPHTNQAPLKFEAEPIKPTNPLQFPSFKIPSLLNPFSKQEDMALPPNVKASVARARSDAAITEDPFEAKNRREMPTDANRTSRAQELLSRGAHEFKNERYAEARLCFEQAYQSDQASL